MECPNWLQVDEYGLDPNTIHHQMAGIKVVTHNTC